MSDSRKRKAVDRPERATQRMKKDWRAGRDGGGSNRGPDHRPLVTARSIEPGDAGVWITCDKGREGKCLAEVRDLFSRYSEEMYGQLQEDGKVEVEEGKTLGEDGEGHSKDDSKTQGKDESKAEIDIEAEIRREVEDLKTSKGRGEAFTGIRLDVQCVLFFKTSPPIEPVSFVHRICHDARHATTSTTQRQQQQRQQTRFLKRLTPITLMGRAYEKDLDELARTVLGPHFHGSTEQGKKFAIRPSLRNHSVLTREVIIRRVAAAVGPGHTVDLKHYDLLILVEVYKNVCGMSVVGRDYDELKRYNLAEIHDSAGADRGDEDGRD